MRCLRQCEEYYFDRKCRVRICEECMEYCKKATGDKKRCIIQKCDKNHVLTYISGPTDYLDYCSECKQQKIIKLKCFVCEEEFEG